MDIYWIKDKRQCGPATVPDVISQLQVGELTPDTLGWHAGCAQWAPLKDLPALADFLHKKEEGAEEPEATPTGIGTASADAEAPEKESMAQALPTAPAEQPPAQELADEGPAAPAAANDNTSSTRVYLPSPLARLLARFVDCALYAVLYSAVITLQAIPYSASLVLLANPLLWLPMLLLEAWMLSTWGTTPGKALMGIHLTTFGEVQRLSFLRALLRALMVFTLGMAFMIVQLMPIMLAFEYWMLRRRGITPWDARSSTLPTQKAPSSPSRYVLSLVILYVSSVLFFSTMKPWLPGMIDDIARTNPEMALTLRKLMPEGALQTSPTEAAPTATPSPGQPAQDTSLPGI